MGIETEVDDRTFQIQVILEEGDESELKELLQDAGVEDEAEISERYKTKSPVAVDGIVMVLTSTAALIKIAESVKGVDWVRFGMQQTNEGQFYIDDVDAETVEEYGGNVIAEEGDDVYFTLPQDSVFEMLDELEKEKEE